MKKKPTIAELRRAFDKARSAELRAIEAVPETSPPHEPSPRAKYLAEQAWAAAAKTLEARAALSAALDRIGK